MSVEDIRQKVTAGRDAIADPVISEASAAWYGAPLARLNGTVRNLAGSLATLARIAPHAQPPLEQANAAALSTKDLLAEATTGTANAAALDMVEGANLIAQQTAARMEMGVRMAVLVPELHALLANLDIKVREFEEAHLQMKAADEIIGSLQASTVNDANTYLATLAGPDAPA